MVGVASYFWFEEVYPLMSDGRLWLEVTASLIPAFVLVGLALVILKCVQWLGAMEGGTYLLVSGFFIASVYVADSAFTAGDWAGVGAAGLFLISQFVFIVVLWRRKGDM